MMRSACLALLGCLLLPAAAQAKYIPLELGDMLGSSDLVLTGTITRVGETTFELEIERLVAGEFKEPHIEVARFRDWACARRWAPYAVGQQVLLCLFRAHGVDGKPKWAIRSGGGEGEMPLREGYVYYRAANLPVDGEGEWELDGTTVSATRIPFPQLARAARGLRRCYTWKLDRSTPIPLVTGVERTGTPEQVAELRKSSPMAAFLVDQVEAAITR